MIATLPNPNGFADEWSIYHLDTPPAIERASLAFVPITQRAPAFAELQEVFLESQQRHHGAHSAAVSENTYGQARKFLGALPADIPSPEMLPDADGLVHFEWFKTPKMVGLVAIGSDYSIHYAFRHGETRLHGSSPYYSVIPDEVLNQIRKICK